MAGETINQTGAYAVCLSSELLATTAFTTAPTTQNSVAASVATAEKDYPLLDFKLTATASVSAVFPVNINLYRRNSDATPTPSAVPSGTNKSQYVGSFTLNSATDVQYLRGAVNSDNNDTFYLENTDATAASSITMQLDLRARTYNAAA